MSEHVSKERMHEALDGVLASSEIGEVQTHLDGCAVCRNEYARLSEVVRAIGTLPRSARPPETLWEGIRAEIEAVPQDTSSDEVIVLQLPTGRVDGGRDEHGEIGDVPALSRQRGLHRREVRLSFAQLAAAAAVVALVSAGAMRLSMQGPAATEGVRTAEAPTGPGGAAARAVSLEEGRYTEIVDQLERVLSEGRSLLAQETLVTIDEALRTVDEAIDDIETALAEDPNSDLLLRLLATHQNTRLGVLQRAVGAVQAQS